MKIYGFYHICLINDWELIVKEQIDLIVKSGLYSKTDAIFIGCLGAEDNRNRLQKLINNKNKFRIVLYNNNIKLYEMPILQHLQNLCQQDKEFLLWYIHTKGVISRQVAWRNNLNTIVIKYHEYCIKLLENPDIGAVGPMLRCGGFPFNLGENINHHYHFRGNFWWAKSHYVKKIKVNLTDMMKRHNSRYIAEAFIGMLADPKMQEAKEEDGKKYFKGYIAIKLL